MIRQFIINDLDSVMKIWLDTNLKAHNFILQEYWKANYDAVKEMMPQAEIYVYEDETAHQVLGFAGLTGSYLAGIFVEENAQSKGIGKQLLDCVKKIKSEINLNVYQKNVRAVSFYLREKFIIRSESIDSETNEKELIMTWKNSNDGQC